MATRKVYASCMKKANLYPVFALSLVALSASAETYRPGLLQAKSNSNTDWTFDFANSAILVERVPGPVMADVYAAEDNCNDLDYSYQNEETGSVYHWNKQYSTFAYKGEIYLVAGTTYAFGKRLDDGARITIGDTKVLDNNTWDAFATGTYTPATTGWYPIDIRLADGTGGKGPQGGGINGASGLGLAYNTDGVTSQSKGAWQRLVDPGDLSLFRAPVDEVIQTVQGITYANGVYTFQFSIPGSTSAGTARVYLDASAESVANLDSWAVSSSEVTIPAGGTASVSVAWNGTDIPRFTAHVYGADVKGAFESLSEPTALNDILLTAAPVLPAATLDESAFCGTVVFCGAGASSCDVTFAYALKGSTLPAGTTETGIAGGGTFSFPMTDLVWATAYDYRLTVSNGGVTQDLVLTGTFKTPTDFPAEPGLYQGRFGCTKDASPNLATRLSDIPADLVDRTLGMLMARASSDNVTTSACTDELTTQAWGWTQDNICFLYEGYIWLTEGVPFYVVSKFDDGGAIFIDDVEVFSQWTQSRGSGYSDTANRTVGVFTPSMTGWYPLRGYIWDWAGGKVRMWGIAGIQWTTDPAAIDISGTTPKAVDSLKSNATFWHEFYDDGSGTFLSAGNIAEISVQTAVMEGDTLVATLSVPDIGPATLYAWFGETAGGSDGADWASSMDLGTVSGDGTETRFVRVPLGSAKYVRFATVAGDAPASSLSETLFRSRMATVSGDPVVTASAATSITISSAVLPFRLVSPGAGATSCDIDVVYGLSPEVLVHTNSVLADATAGAEGSAALTDLLPGRQYYAAALARSDLGASALSDIVVFQTAALAESGIAGESQPGLWQALTNVTRDRTTDPATATGAEIIPEGAVMVCSGDRAEAAFSSYTSPAGTVFGYGEHITYSYSGYMFMQKGVTYTFCEDYDDWGFASIDGHAFFNDCAWNSTLFESYVPEETRWYPVLFRVSNDGGQGGPHMGAFAKGYLGAGLGFSTNETTLTTANYMNWQAPTNTADAILFRTAPFLRPIDLVSPTVSDGTLSVVVETAADNTARDLYVCYGATYADTDTNAWDVVKFVGSVPAAATSYTSSGDVTGVYDTARYVRFFFDCEGDGLSWSRTLVFADPSLPSLDASTEVTGIERGDGVAISGSLLATGGSECTVTLEVAATEDFSDAVVWPAATTTVPCDLLVDVYTNDTESAYYIQPGVTYYYRFVVVNEDGGFDVSSVGTFTTDAGVALGDVSASSSLFIVTVTGTFDDFGAGDTTLWLLAGDAPDALAPAGEQTLSDGADSYTFTVEAPAVGVPFYYAVVASNACSTAVWGDRTATQSITCIDSATYYWKGDVQTGAWNDAANWDTEPDDPRLLYPNSSSALVRFTRCTSGEPYVVSVPGAYNVNVLIIGANDADITFLGSGGETSRIQSNRSYDDYVPGFGLSEGDSVTFDGVYFDTPDCCRIPDRATLRLLNGATFQVHREIWMYGADALIDAHGDSLVCVADWSFQLYGPRGRVVLDDSTLQVNNNQAYIAHASGAISNVVEFAGTHPKLIARGLTAAGDGGANADNTTPPELVFHVPAEGYAEAPIQRMTDQNVVQGADKQYIKIVIAKDSPFFSGGKEAIVPLIAWKYGILASRLDLSNQPKPAQTSFFWTYGKDVLTDPTATTPDGSNPTGLWATLKGCGATVILFR